MSKYFTSIEEWKKSDEALKDAQNGDTINTKEDYFVVHAHWKIKDKPDIFHFKSLKSLIKWAQEDDKKPDGELKK